MNNFAKIVCGVVGLMSLLTACGAESGGKAEEALEPIQVDLTQLAVDDDEGAPGEDPNARDKAGRVYIEYCDRPNNSAGTICRTYDGTLRSEDFDECRRDTRSVCGRERATWIICAGQPCWYM